MKLTQIDPKELELPDTVFSRHIEGKVFQGIAMQTLAQIEGVAPIEGNFIDDLLGGMKGIHVEQDQKNHSVEVKIELNVALGTCIPEKAEEIQMKIAQEVSRSTGLHVSGIHLVFKALISQDLESILERKLP